MRIDVDGSHAAELCSRIEAALLTHIKGGKYYTSDKRLYLDAEGNVVGPKDPKRLALLAPEGGTIGYPVAEMYGLVGARSIEFPDYTTEYLRYRARKAGRVIGDDLLRQPEFVADSSPASERKARKRRPRKMKAGGPGGLEIYTEFLVPAGKRDDNYKVGQYKGIYTVPWTGDTDVWMALLMAAELIALSQPVGSAIWRAAQKWRVSQSEVARYYNLHKTNVERIDKGLPLSGMGEPRR